MVDPQAEIHREHDHGWFDAAFPFGGAEDSIAPAMVTLRLASTAMAASFALWLRTHLLPSGTGIAFMTHEAIELHEQPCALPDGNDPEILVLAPFPCARVPGPVSAGFSAMVGPRS